MIEVLAISAIRSQNTSIMKFPTSIVTATFLLFLPFLMSAETSSSQKPFNEYAGGSAASLTKTVVQAGVPEKPWGEALAYFEEHQDKLANRRYITIVDYSRLSSEPRMWIVEMKTGAVEKRLTSHGAGKDDRKNPRDLPRYFSNTPNSNEGSLGFFITGTEYPSPKFKRALNLHGQEETNSNAYERRIVFHGADYVNDEKGEAGRSHGCPAVDNEHAYRLIDELKDGSLFYITLTKPLPKT